MKMKDLDIHQIHEKEFKIPNYYINLLMEQQRL